MHSIDVAGSRTKVRGTIDLGRKGKQPLLRFLPFARGDLAVIALEGARVDGYPVVGGIAIVEWGRGAVVRTLDLRVDVRFERLRETRAATAGSRCALCFGRFGHDESANVCPCETSVHEDCFEVMISCPSCGEPA